MRTRTRFSKGSLLWAALIVLLALGALSWLVAGPNWDAGGPWGASAAAPTPVPSGDSNLQGLLFGGNPGVSGDWTDGNVCAGNRPAPGCYSDGEDVPHRVLVKNLIVGASYEIAIEHDFEDAGGVVGYENFNDFAAISGVTNLAPTSLGTFPSGGGRTEKRYSLTFDAAAASGEIRWDALLGPQAHTWNGAQLHVRLTEGAESVPIPVKEIVPPTGTIIVEKQTVPDGAAGNFTFTDRAAGTISDNGQIIVTDLVAGTYTSIEGSTPGFDLTAISCDDGASANPSSGNVGTRTATFNLDPGEIVKCTFTNTLRSAKFLVKKDFIPNSGASVSVSLSCTSGSVSPASASAAEGSPAEFTLTGYNGNPTCTATESPIPAGYDSTGTCAAALSAGECTITNTLRRAKFLVKKDFIPNSGDRKSVV